MNIIVTGSSGFIGFHLCKKLLQNNMNKVFGIDNIDNYYDIKIKNQRTKILKKFNNFKFFKANICNKIKTKNIFNKIKKIDVVIHLAAQAGVRYSFINPQKYLDVNIDGFFNILELVKKLKINFFIFASSSSVYGDSNAKILKEKDNEIKPISLYGATKLANENIAYTYSKLFKLNCVGLRFFTVYGPWGRPDMSLYEFTNRMVKKKNLFLFNNGNHIRDFTYIDDVVNGILCVINYRLKLKKQQIPFKIFNISSSKPVKLKTYLSLIEKKLNIKAKIKLLPLQKGDVERTYGDTNLIKKIGYLPKTTIKKGISNFVDWYKSYNK